ncbi:MAG: hypothetical protein IT208_06970 [Chthonomonadales bacterium]|nr:hypothetical protein [Chthonomonadales bacterium]
MRISLNGSDWRILGLVPTEWVWRGVGKPETNLDAIAPACPPWLPATVPGDVQSDLLDAGELPDWRHDLQSRACEWVSQRDWVYRKEFACSPEQAAAAARLRFEGVDYGCHVFLNGHHLGDHAGTYTPFELDATGKLTAEGPNRLVIVVDHAPSEDLTHGQIGWTSRIRIWKPRFAYQWDWCTRLVPLGIWEDVDLVTFDAARIVGLQVHPRADDGEENGQVHARVRVEGIRAFTGRLRLCVTAPDGTVAAAVQQGVGVESEMLDIDVGVTIDAVRRWFPNGAGSQPLYHALAELLDEEGRVVDTEERRFGFRTVHAVANDGAPPDALPYVLEVNGVRTFIKGWNWAPIDQLYGRAHEQQYRHAIRMARDANCNLLRVWGGGLLERELFYDLCDEAGIMVWQELFHSSSGIDNEPPTDLGYIAYAREQTEQIVPRRANHPSLVIWCGGNELTTASDQRPVTMDHPTIAAMREIVERLDPDRIFLPSSPSGPEFSASPGLRGRMHDVHGHWLYMGNPEHYGFYNEIDPLLHSEFGVEGAANLPTLRRTFSERYLWPPDATNAGWVHHGSWWLNRPRVEGLFGRIEDIETFVPASQWLQAEGLRYAVEASRRRKWRTSGSMPWQYNESWPNASCTNSLDYYGMPRPAYWVMRRAYAHRLVSAAYDGLVWKPGEPWHAFVWVNVSGQEEERLTVHWTLIELAGGEIASGAIAVTAGGGVGGAVPVARIEAALPERPGIVLLRLDLRDGQGRSLADNEYLFSTAGERPFAPLLEAAAGRLAVSAEGSALRLEADGGAPVFGTAASAKADWSGPYLSEGYWQVLLPGEARRVSVGGDGVVAVSALGQPETTIAFPAP